MKNLKAKYWKRTLALLLAVSMILTSNAFSAGAVSVYAAEKEDEISGDVISPEEGAVGTEDSTSAPDSSDVPDAGDAGDPTSAPDAGDNADTPDAGETGDAADVADEEDVSAADEAEEAAEVLKSTDTTEDGNLEGENPVVENYGAIGLTVKEFEKVIENVDILWEKEEGEEQSSYEARWESEADTETLLNKVYEVNNEYEYAYIQPQKPGLEDRTITIPETIKGVIISNGWFEESTGDGSSEGAEPGENNEGGEGDEGGNSDASNGYPIDIPLDTLNVKGENTLVYFRKGSNIDAGEGNRLNILFPENNKNKVVFNENTVNAVIECNSESGTIAFGGINTINGYKTKCTTEFYSAIVDKYDEDDNFIGPEQLDSVNLLIKEAGGLSFEEITGNDSVSVSVVFNGYPTDKTADNLAAKLPHFNKPIELGTAKDDDGDDYDIGVGISFRQYRDKPFGEDGTENWWETVQADECVAGDQIAYFAGTSRNEKVLIGCKVFYTEHGNDELDLFLESDTGRLMQEFGGDEPEQERFAYEVFELSEDEYNKLKEDEEKLWNDYGDKQDETNTLAEYLAVVSREYVVIRARKSSHALNDKVLELPENIKGVMLISDYTPVPDGAEGTVDKRLEWQFDTLKVKAGMEVYLNGIDINTDGKDFNIELQNETSKVIIDNCTVNALVKCTSEPGKGTIEFVNDNIVNGYITDTVTNFSAFERNNADNENIARTDAKLLIREAAGLSFEEITGNVDVFIVYNGYPKDDLENKLPYFNEQIDLGEVKNGEDDGTHEGNVELRFWNHIDDPFGLDGTSEWWEVVPAETLVENTQVAYFAGDNRDEQEAISCRVHYYRHPEDGEEEDNLDVSYKGRLRINGEEDSGEYELGAYSVIKLNDAADYAAVKKAENLWDGTYDSRWEETDDLANYLENSEYLVIQVREASHALNDKVLDLPDNIKGVMLVPEYIQDPNDGEGAEYKRVEWKLDTLNVGAGTEVYTNDIGISSEDKNFTINAGADSKIYMNYSSINANSMDININVGSGAEVHMFGTANTKAKALNIDLAAATSKVIFESYTVNALVNCDSTVGTIEFINDNVINGYITKTKTHFKAPEPVADEEPTDNAKLLIKEAAGLSFEEITGDDVNVFIVFNGYPKDDLKLLPYFNKSIELGTCTDNEGNDYQGNISIGFRQYIETPFENNWWFDDNKDTRKVGDQIAYFAGTSRNEMRAIGERVVSDDEEEGSIYLCQITGRLMQVGKGLEEAVYSVLELDKTAYDAVKADTGLLWVNNNPYDDKWDETDTLADYLAVESREYVVIIAKEASHDLEDKTLKLPSNIKGVLLLSNYNDDERVEWQLNTIKAEGSKEIYIDDVAINPMSQAIGAADTDPADQGFKIEATSADVNVVMVNSEIMGDLSISGVADIKFIESKVFGATDLGSDKTTKVSLKGLFVADNLNGYSALDIIGDTTFIVRYHGEVVIESCTFNRTNESSDQWQNLTLVYNGYPKEAELLPVFGDNINFPDNCGITLRFVQQSDEIFWESEDENYNWWDNTPDEPLLIGSQIATVKIDENKFENLMEHFGYCRKDEESLEGIKFVRDEETGALCIMKESESGNKIVNFALQTGNTKTYDGAEFEISESSVINNCGYTGKVNLEWLDKDEKPLDQAPKNAGSYKFKMSVPADTQGFEGETTADITITPKTVTVSVKPNDKKANGYEINWDGFIGNDTYTTEVKAVMGEEITEEDGKKYHMVHTEGGDAGDNYTIVHAAPVKIAVKEERPIDENKPLIKGDGVLFPKRKPTYSAVYTGEEIRPVMVVSYSYTDGSKPKTQKLKLNVDYILTYEDNVNVTDDNNKAKVTVRGIGEYSGVVEKEFEITPKSIKKVTLSAVGDILQGQEPVVTVMDGNYELVKGEDYELADDKGTVIDDWSKQGSATVDTQFTLKVKGIGNYKDVSNKKAKFNILKTEGSTDIKSIADEGVTVEFKKPNKVYTYNGKAQKPAVLVKDGGVKVPASKYKVIYSNNVNAGTQTATVKVVGVSKKGKGYYGVSEELKFDIKQKSFAKVSVSSIAAVPKTADFDGVTMTVKDGKRILKEDEDYTVDYSSFLNEDGTFKAGIVIGQKYDVKLKPIDKEAGNNYLTDTEKVVKIKFGQLNLASKTANISVEIKDASKGEVEVKYNGVLLTAGTDYTVTLKQDKGKSTYTVTIKAVKKSAYKGKKVVKNLTAPTTPEPAPAHAPKQQ